MINNPQGGQVASALWLPQAGEQAFWASISPFLACNQGMITEGMTVRNECPCFSCTLSLTHMCSVSVCFTFRLIQNTAQLLGRWRMATTLFSRAYPFTEPLGVHMKRHLLSQSASCHCDRIPETTNLKERFILVSSFRCFHSASCFWTCSRSSHPGGSTWWSKQPGCDRRVGAWE